MELSLPLPDGGLARFRVMESPIMAPALAAKFPNIKTYVAQGVDDPLATARLDWTIHGFHAQVLSSSGATYIDPYFDGDTATYVVYQKRDYPRPEGFSCHLEEGDQPAGGANVAVVAAPSGDELRTYRLAVAATGEYTQFHGGTVEAGLSAIVTAVNRVTGIYEVEVAVRMELVANNDLVVYTDGATDPYTNSNGFAMLSQNQNNLDAVIGSANYDIGHVFSTGGGGVAGLGVVCDSSKAWGVTGLPAPIGDPFYVDYVAHEMGHQFGAPHTFNGINGSCSGNRSAAAAFEPGSGSTIMAYAGICGADNLQPNSDPYFHGDSFDDIRTFTTASTGNLCAAITTTGNTAPNISAGADYAIPGNTPFVLTASGLDPDDDEITYCWEEFDLGPAAALSEPDDGGIPLFRSLNPTPDPSRYFPSLPDVVNDADDPAEKMPASDRTMLFRVTARDHRAGGGGVDGDHMSLTVLASSPPFVVINPTTIVNSNGPQLVEWAVGDTADPPIGASQVDILLSTDNGASFPFLLAVGTPNDGSETVTIPDVPTTMARIMVKAMDNVFYAVSDLCPETAAPLMTGVNRNRYLPMESPNAGRQTAVRVRFTNLPGAYAAFNGSTMWVGPPTEVCENSGQVAPPTGGCASVPNLPNNSFMAATLHCDPYYTDWGAMGPVQVYHRTIVPGATYTVDTIDALCNVDLEFSYSVSVEMGTAKWGDTVSNCTTAPCGAPNNIVEITDIVAILDKFTNAASAPSKARADLDPATPDRTITISDVTGALGAFSGSGFPFLAGASPCP